MTLSSALDAVRELSYEDRLRLIHVMLDEIAGEQPQEPLALNDEEKAEIKRRIADHRAHPERAIPWEQVRAEALARYEK